MTTPVSSPLNIPLDTIYHEAKLYGTSPPDSPIKRIRDLIHSTPRDSLQKGINEGHKIIELKRQESPDSVMAPFIQLTQTFRRPIEDIDGFPANEEFFKCNLGTFADLKFLGERAIPTLMERGEHPAKEEEIKRFYHEVGMNSLDKNLEAFKQNVLVYFSYIRYFSAHPGDFNHEPLTFRELREVFVCAPEGILKSKVATALKNRALQLEFYPLPPLSETESQLSSAHDYPIPSSILTQLVMRSECSKEEIKQLCKKVHPSYLFCPSNFFLFMQSFRLNKGELTEFLTEILKEIPEEYFSKWIEYERRDKIKDMVEEWVEWSDNDNSLLEHFKVLLVKIEAFHPDVCSFKNRNLSNYVALSRFFEECEALNLSDEEEIQHLKSLFLKSRDYRLFNLNDLNLYPIEKGGLYCGGGVFMVVIVKFLTNKRGGVLINIFDSEILPIIYQIKLFGAYRDQIQRALARHNSFVQK